MAKQSADEKSASAMVDSRRKVSPDTTENNIKVDKLPGMKIPGAASNGLSAATDMCRKHGERGSYGPTIGGHKITY